MQKLTGLFLLGFIAISCGSNSGTKKGSSQPANAPNLNTPVTTAPAPTPLPALPTNTQGQPATTNSNTSSAALNPAHGLPGHRCDLQVGAPLNSKPVSTTLPATTKEVAQPTIQLPAKSNAKLNPAHGQPGHDCAVPVGQPLKS